MSPYKRHYLIQNPQNVHTIQISLCAAYTFVFSHRILVHISSKIRSKIRSKMRSQCFVVCRNTPSKQISAYECPFNNYGVGFTELERSLWAGLACCLPSAAVLGFSLSVSLSLSPSLSLSLSLSLYHTNTFGGVNVLKKGLLLRFSGDFVPSLILFVFVGGGGVGDASSPSSVGANVRYDRAR
jgi:hypothetical protein